MKRPMRVILETTFAAWRPHLLFAPSENFVAAQSRPPRARWVRFPRPAIATLAALISLFCAGAAYAQSGSLDSASSPVVNSLGQPMGGVDVAICQPLATTAAQVTSNTAVLTMATNPITAGFGVGMQIQVAGFSGADTYFNGGTFANGTGITGGYTILSVTSTTIAYSLAHANATATTNGTVLQQGNSTTPCAGLSSIYSDAALTQALAQPITTDGLGNWNAFAATGSSQLFYVQFYGAGVTTSFRAMVVSMNGAAVKPQTSDAVQYVSPNGNDGNDGLSLGTAKLTLLAAYNALPARGGTIYVTGNFSSQVACTSVSGQGLGIAGSSDPNYASMPEVLNGVQWVQAKTDSVRIQGVSNQEFGLTSSVGSVTPLACGNATTPAIWLSDISAGFSMDRISLTAGSVALRLGIDSNNSRTSTLGASSSMEFTNLALLAAVGPTVDAGGLLNVKFDHISAGNSGGNPVNQNNASNFYFSTSNAGPFLGNVYLRNIYMYGNGGIRFDAQTGVNGQVDIEEAFVQGAGTCQPTIEFQNQGNLAAYIGGFIGTSDCSSNVPLVKVAAGINRCSVTISALPTVSTAPLVEGPANFGGGGCGISNVTGGNPGYADLVPFPTEIPAARNQQSGTPYSISSQADSFRRSFLPSLVRFANLAAQLPGSWTTGEGTGNTLTQIHGPGDPSGAANAATLNCTANGANGGCDYLPYSASVTLNAGDYLYIAAWVQPAGTKGFAACGDFNGCPIGLELATNTPCIHVMAGFPGWGTGNVHIGEDPVCNGAMIFQPPYNQTDGNWQYLWAVAQVVTPAAGATQINFHVAFKTGFPVNVYAPMFVRIPASTVALVSAPTFSSASESGNTVTWTTSANHNLYGAMPIVISGCSISGYNGHWTVTGTPSGTTFTTYNPTTSLGSPAGCVITPGNDSEVADWANNLASYGDNCASGTFCGIRGVTVPKVVASGTSTLTNSAIGSGACATVVTASASGVLSSDRIEWSYASAPATADGLLTLSPYVTSGNVNWKLCNPTASSQTPSGLVVNWAVLR